MNPSTSKALTDLKSKLAEKETVISQLKKRLRSEDRSNTILSQRDACDAVVDLCENHFQCAVCNELLVKATGLGCGHIFCRDCVNKWKKKSESTMNATTFLGKRATCPICRSEITMQSALKNIDSFLERAVDIFFNDDAKKSRKELLSTVTPSTSTATSIRLLTSGLSLPSTTPSTSSSTVRLVPSGSFLPSTSSGSRRPLNYGFLGPAFSLLADASADPALVIIDDWIVSIMEPLWNTSRVKHSLIFAKTTLSCWKL